MTDLDLGSVLLERPIVLTPERRAKLLHLAVNDGQAWTADQAASGWTDHMAEMMYGADLDRVEGRLNTDPCALSACVVNGDHHLHHDRHGRAWRTVATGVDRAQPDPDGARVRAHPGGACVRAQISVDRTVVLIVLARAAGYAAGLADGEEQGRARAAADLRWLAAARKEYEHGPCPAHEGEARTRSWAQLGVHDEHHAAEQLAGILDGPAWHAHGWLPSWRWETWRRRLAGHRHEAEGTTE